MSDEIYCDGIGNIQVTGTLVRIDLISMVDNDAEGKPRFRISRRLILPLDAFVRSFSLQENTMKKLMEAGIVGKTDA